MGVLSSLLGAKDPITGRALPWNRRQPRNDELIDGHASLVLPDPPGSVEFEYGEWKWFALGKKGSVRVPPTLFWATPGALGRRDLPFPPDREILRRRDCQGVFEFHVSAAAADRLRNRLKARHQTGLASAVFNPEVDMVFVPEETPYRLTHNCNHVLAAWLRELGFEIRGGEMFARFRIESPAPPKRTAAAPSRSAQ